MKTQRTLKLILMLGSALAVIQPASADVIFTLLPANGNVFGPPGSLVGWGYSLQNTDAANWFMSTGLNSDSFANGTPTLLFDFPILGPGGIATQAFDPLNSLGLFQLQWDVSAPVGFVNSGTFVLSGELWDGDPLNGGSFIAAAPDVGAAYSAGVTSPTGVVPEPSSFMLLGSALALAAAGAEMKRHRSRQQS
jgi:hypothetical protein